MDKAHIQKCWMKNTVAIYTKIKDMQAMLYIIYEYTYVVKT